jgi:uncharacterized OB-fold protein
VTETAGPIELDGGSTAFWEGLERGRLIVSLCRSCGRQLFPPIGTCTHCGSANVIGQEVSGDGTVYSWATVHMPLDASFADQVPYTVVVVELAGGARMFGRLRDDGRGGLEAGAPVRFEPVRIGGRAVPGFRLASDR